MNPKKLPMLFVVAVFVAPLLALLGWWVFALNLPQTEQGVARMLVGVIGLAVLMLLMAGVFAAVYTQIQTERSAAVFAQAFGVLLVIQASIVMGGCGLACVLDNTGGV